MQVIKDKLCAFDRTEFSSELYNDRNNPNGNKLRSYRLYKETVQVEQYIQCQIPRNVRRTMTLFRCGALPLSVETGRYAKPQIPLENRLCTFCDMNVIEDEKHFLIDCPLYSDIRFELFQKASEQIDGFHMMTSDLKFVELLKNSNVQISVAFSLHKFFQRRKRFL